MSTWDIPSARQLPEGWAYDPILRDEIRTRIRRLHRAGAGSHEIARRVGVCSRTVTRTIRHQLPSENRA